jgi:hypothetical protein
MGGYCASSRFGFDAIARSRLGARTRRETRGLEFWRLFERVMVRAPPTISTDHRQGVFRAGSQRRS